MRTERERDYGIMEMLEWEGIAAAYCRNTGAMGSGIWDAERLSLSGRVAQMISGSIAHPHYTQQNDRIVDDMSKMPE